MKLRIIINFQQISNLDTFFTSVRFKERIHSPKKEILP